MLFCLADDTYAQSDSEGRRYKSVQRLSGLELMTFSVTTVARQQESALLLARRQRVLLHLFPAMVGFAPPLLSCSQAAWPRSFTLGSSGTGGVLQPPIRSPVTYYEVFSLEIARSLAIKGEFVCRPVYGMGQPSGDRAVRFSANAYQAGYRTSKR